MRKILILVMSAQRPPWGQLLTASLETWDSVQHPQCDTIYYCGAPIGTHPNVPNIFYSMKDEHLPSLTIRTQEALEMSLGKEWDYMARVNSSCYVHKPSLVRKVDSLPETGVLEGLCTQDGGGAALIWGGGQYLMSRDTVEKLTVDKERWRRCSVLMEDQAITRMAEGAMITPQQGKAGGIDDLLHGRWRFLSYGSDVNFEFTDFSDLKRCSDHYFIRVKQDHDRTLDVMLMRKLKEFLE